MKCDTCGSKMTEYLGFNAREPEIFCEACESSDDSFSGVDRTEHPVKYAIAGSMVEVW